MHDIYVYVHIYRRTSLAMKTTMSVRFSATFRSASCRVFCFYFFGGDKGILSRIQYVTYLVNGHAFNRWQDIPHSIRMTLSGKSTHTHSHTHTRARTHTLQTYYSIQYLAEQLGDERHVAEAVRRPAAVEHVPCLVWFVVFGRFVLRCVCICVWDGPTHPRRYTHAPSRLSSKGFRSHVSGFAGTCFSVSVCVPMRFSGPYAGLSPIYAL